MNVTDCDRCDYCGAVLGRTCPRTITSMLRAQVVGITATVNEGRVTFFCDDECRSAYLIALWRKASIPYVTVDSDCTGGKRYPY